MFADLPLEVLSRIIFMAAPTVPEALPFRLISKNFCDVIKLVPLEWELAKWPSSDDVMVMRKGQVTFNSLTIIAENGFHSFQCRYPHHESQSEGV